MSMFKRSVKSVLGGLGYELTRKDRPARRPEPAPSNIPPAELAQAHAELAQCGRDRDAYKKAAETAAAELGQMRMERDGYKNAYDTVCTELSGTRVILSQYQPDPDVVREAMLVDPPIRHKLGDDPALLTEVWADVARLTLPPAAARILTDANFSVEDREKYHGLIKALPGFDTWDDAGGIIAKIITAQYIRCRPRSADPDLARRRAETLRREGIVKLGTLLSPTQMAEVQDYLFRRPVFNGHIPTSAKHRVLRRYLGHTAEQFPLGCYPAGDIAMAPHLLEMIFHPDILDAATAYFGCAPTLTWLQTWWNFVGQGKYVHGQNNYHRDENDLRMFWVYMYVTDVTEGCGPHAMIRRSADFQLLRETLDKARRDPRIAERLGNLTFEDFCGPAHGLPDALKEELFPGLKELLTGPAGTVFITRGSDFHKVVTPITKKRCLFAARFCMNEFADPGPQRDGDPIPGEEVARRVGDDELLRHVTRLRFDWGGRHAF
jgi:hypothetical protein